MWRGRSGPRPLMPLSRSRVGAIACTRSRREGRERACSEGSVGVRSGATSQPRNRDGGDCGRPPICDAIAFRSKGRCAVGRRMHARCGRPSHDKEAGESMRSGNRLIAIVALLALAGCGGSQAASSTGTTSTAASSSATATGGAAQSDPSCAGCYAFSGGCRQDLNAGASPAMCGDTPCGPTPSVRTVPCAATCCRQP